MELLSPAGSMESVIAAVQNGADAVYFGYGDFNARRNAKNFTPEDVAAAVEYCHLRGCKVNLTLNTLLTDRELPVAAELAAHASAIGVDALIVQDIGVVNMLRRTVPDLPVHGSTQMSVHSLDGVKRCADLGMERVVLARELPREQIAYICQHSPIEIETFAHGALCMCYSGQCFFSSVIGGRSGNRGLCAQPCRLNYGWAGRADEYPLSLKDCSLAGHLRQLQEMGVACLKIEGRMKRPEYVAIVTGIYARALREKREPTPEEMRQLEQAFSRQGFTDGYFTDRHGPAMFGTRQEQVEPKQLYAQARTTYQSGEHRTVGVRFEMELLAEQPVRLTARDEQGHTAQADGPVPERAVKVPLTHEKVEGQLSRTGGTVFHCTKLQLQMDEGLSLPLSALNRLRRQALEALSEQITALPHRRTQPFSPAKRIRNGDGPPQLTVSLRTASQATPELMKLHPALLYLPVEELSAHPEVLERADRFGVPVAAALPRICWDREWPEMEKNLRQLQQAGVEQVLCPTWDAVERAGRLGLRLRGDYGLGIFNSLALEELERMGLVSAAASFELKLAQVRDLAKAIDVELLVYGRLPLMITENCIIHNHTGAHSCQKGQQLTDRRGESFPVVPVFGCRNEILNSKPVFLADRAEDYARLGLWAARLQFTTESPGTCARILGQYQEMSGERPRNYTRGLYYRDVE